MDIFAPIQFFSDFVVYTIFSLQQGTYFAEAIHFFLYDSIKIGLLLVLINYIMAIFRTFFPMNRVRDILSKRKWYGVDYLLAALFGVVTPFCSCSSIPLFVGFLSSGIPIGVTFTFLIASPLVNESSLYLFPAVFGMKTTVLYNVLGIVISIIGGIVIQKLRMERCIQSDFLSMISKTHASNVFVEKKSLREYLHEWNQEVFEITRRIFPYVLLGVAIGAGIHGFVPESLITSLLSDRHWWTVIVATMIGIPMYANSVTIVPIAEALVEKGASLGAVLAFMTATVTLSLPEAVMLRRVMKWQLLATFFGITTIGILCIGFVFSWL